MPNILIRGLDHATFTRVRAYARAQGLHVPDVAADLLRYALDAKEARKAAGQARMARLSPEQRSAHARMAGLQGGRPRKDG